MKKIILIVCGFISLGLGVLGVVLPVLPTTPFVLLSAACFAGSSRKIYDWLASTKYFGAIVRNYKTGCGIPRRVKRMAVTYLWIGLIVSGVLVRNPLMWILLAAVGAGVTLHLVSMKTKK